MITVQKKLSTQKVYKKYKLVYTNIITLLNNWIYLYLMDMSIYGNLPTYQLLLEC